MKWNIFILAALKGRHMIVEKAMPAYWYFPPLFFPCLSNLPLQPSPWSSFCHLPTTASKGCEAGLLPQNLSLTKPFHTQTPKHLPEADCRPDTSLIKGLKRTPACRIKDSWPSAVGHGSCQPLA